jgi:hypothetical protein
VVLAVEIIVAVAVLIGVAFLAARPDIGGLEDTEPDVADIGLPDNRLLRSEDIPRLRFRTVGGIRGIRGYRFSDVDATIAKVEETLQAVESRRSAGTSSASE